MLSTESNSRALLVEKRRRRVEFVLEKTELGAEFGEATQIAEIASVDLSIGSVEYNSAARFIAVNGADPLIGRIKTSRPCRAVKQTPVVRKGIGRLGILPTNAVGRRQRIASRR